MDVKKLRKLVLRKFRLVSAWLDEEKNCVLSKRKLPCSGLVGEYDFLAVGNSNTGESLLFVPEQSVLVGIEKDPPLGQLWLGILIVKLTGRFRRTETNRQPQQQHQKCVETLVNLPGLDSETTNGATS